MREPDLFLFVFIGEKGRPKKGNGGGPNFDLSHNAQCIIRLQNSLIIRLLMAFVVGPWNILYNCLRLPMLT